MLHAMFALINDISSVEDYKIIEELQYNITAEQGSVHDFYIPISVPVYYIPSIEVKVNGTTIETELLYGSNLYHFVSFCGLQNSKFV